MNLLNALINNGYTENEAISEMKFARKRVFAGEDPEEILEQLGLEPDYAFDLL